MWSHRTVCITIALLLTVPVGLSFTPTDPLADWPDLSSGTGSVVAIGPGLLLIDPPAPTDSPETFLFDLLTANGGLGTGWSLEPYHTRTSPLGEHLRYQVIHSGLPLLEREATLHLDGDGAAWFVAHNLPAALGTPARAALGTETLAVAAALAKNGHPAAEAMTATAGWSLVGDVPVPAWMVDVVVPIATLEPQDVRYHIDATGAVLQQRDRLAHYSEGSGDVFPVSPMVAAQDYDLQDTPGALPLPPITDHIETRVFEGLSTAPGDHGRLTGAFAEVLGVAFSPLLDFTYPRGTVQFNEAMAYWHTDQMQRTLHGLGLTDANNRTQVIIANVPGLENALYQPTTRLIALGSHGGSGANAHTAEDPEVTIHENGHAIQHDQVPDWGWSWDQGAMGEGFGDFLAGAVLAADSDGFGDYCIAEWWTSHIRSFLSPPCLRNMDNDYTYSDVQWTGIHYAGQVWSGLLYDIWQEHGWEVALQNVVASHHLAVGGMTMQESADLLLLTDQVLHDSAHAAVIAERAHARELDGPLIRAFLGIEDGGGGTDPDHTYASFPIEPTPRDTTGWATIPAGDDTVHTIDIAPTRFFTEVYDTLYVSSNGFVSFIQTGSGCCSGQPIPQQDGINGIIAGAWSDLDPSRCGRVAYQTTSTSTVVSFEDVCYFGSSANQATFWIEIQTTGQVDLHLLRADGGRQTTTGIESVDGQYGIELRHTTARLATPLAWHLVPLGPGIVPGDYVYIEDEIAAATIDITGWEPLPLRTDEVLTIDIPPTRFYNLNATELHVSSNGFVSFALDGTEDGCCTGGDIPAADGVDGIIAALWTDLDPKRCGTVAYNVTETVKVAFVGVPYYGSDCGPNGATATFWMSITANGTIEIHLLEAAGGILATTGVESLDGETGNQTRQSSDAVTGPLAWRYDLIRLDNGTIPEPPGPEPPEPPEPVDPRVETLRFTGRIGCAISYGPVQSNDRCAELDPNTNDTFDILLERGVSHLHVEVRWEQGDLLGAERLRVTWTAPAGVGGTEGVSPLVHQANVSATAPWNQDNTTAKIHVRIGDDQLLIRDQRFEVCTHVVYGDATVPAVSCFEEEEE